MNAITTLDVAIGLAFLYLLFSMMCSTLIEWFSAVFARRAKLLKRGIEEALGGSQSTLAKDFHAHPLITGLHNANGYPNYIPASTFTQALMSLTTEIAQTGGLTTVAVKRGLERKSTRLIKSLLSGADTVGQAQERIEKWFNGAMERVSGWYKRWTQLWTTLLAIVIVIGCDVDTIHFARKLNQDAALRSLMVQAGTRAADAGSLEKLEKKARELEIPIGLRPPSRDWSAERVLGLLISVLALSLGAPFWFDLLNRLVNLRQTGTRPGTSQGKGIVAH